MQIYAFFCLIIFCFDMLLIWHLLSLQADCSQRHNFIGILFQMYSLVKFMLNSVLVYALSLCTSFIY